MKRFIFLLLVCLSFGNLHAQPPMPLRIQQISMSNVPAVHSGAFGTYQNKWFFIGGRSNGLHGFQPPSAFPTSGINDVIYITDPQTNQTWTAGTYSLPTSVREAINSSNMQFYLSDSMLYMMGGYGWMDSIENFITWPTLTAINMKGLMQAVIQGQPITPYFRQLEDQRMAVCGSHVYKIDDVYYLVFGHRYDGTYSRLDNSGLNVQEYTHEIRTFKIADDGLNLSITDYSAVNDTANFRRRDYNLIPQRYANGTEGLTAFTGVFQKGIDIPYLNCIDIFNNGTYTVRNDFNQNLSQYHSAVCALYDTTTATQYNLFFGGMSMYYVDTATNLTVTDSLVPFVQTISCVTRDSSMQYTEYNLPIRMPALLGTNAYFFPDLNAPLIKNHYINVSPMQPGQRIGYIVGGIESPELNISLTDPSFSFASARVFEVALDGITGQAEAQRIVNDITNYYAKPNPVAQSTTVYFECSTPTDVTIELLSVEGKLLKTVLAKQTFTGAGQCVIDMAAYPAGFYNCLIKTGRGIKSIRLVKK